MLDMLINITSSIKALDMKMKIGFDKLNDRLDKIENCQSIASTAIVSSPAAQANFVRQKNTGQWTRQVMSKILAIYIQCLWIECHKDNNVNKSIPIELDYLTKLINALDHNCTADTRSNLGKTFGMILDSHPSNITINVLSQLLQDNASLCATKTRSHIMRSSINHIFIHGT